VNDDLLPEHVDIDAYLDAYLAAARRAHAARLPSLLDLDAGLAAILTPGKDASRDEPATGVDPSAPAPSRPGPPPVDGQAAAIIMMQALARALARAVDLAHDLDLALADTRDLADIRARVRELGLALADTLADARVLADTRTLADTRFLVDAIANVSAFARLFTRDLDALALAHARRRAIALHRDLRCAFGRVKGVIGRFHAGEVDASGANLSALNLSEMSVLDGVLWTDETMWPPGVREQVWLWSDEIRPGVYLVRGGSERDPSELTSRPDGRRA
jgi:hypothetical protein